MLVRAEARTASTQTTWVQGNFTCWASGPFECQRRIKSESIGFYLMMAVYQHTLEHQEEGGYKEATFCRNGSFVAARLLSGQALISCIRKPPHIQPTPSLSALARTFLTFTSSNLASLADGMGRVAESRTASSLQKSSDATAFRSRLPSTTGEASKDPLKGQYVGFKLHKKVSGS